MSELKAVTSEELGQSIGKAFGLDPSKGHRRDCTNPPRQTCICGSSGLVEEPEAAQFAEQLTRYELVPAQG